MSGRSLILITICAYLAAVNLIAFAAMGRDKKAAQRGTRRTPEKTLFLLAVIGGSIGAMAGMKVFHHKTKHKSFTIGMPLILTLQLVLLLWFLLGRR